MYLCARELLETKWKIGFVINFPEHKHMDSTIQSILIPSKSFDVAEIKTHFT